MGDLADLEQDIDLNQGRSLIDPPNKAAKILEPTSKSELQLNMDQMKKIKQDLSDIKNEIDEDTSS